jgi:hypothetical protein
VCESPCPPAGKKGHRKNEDATGELLENLFGGDEALAARYKVRKTSAYGISRITLLEAADDTDE